MKWILMMLVALLVGAGVAEARPTEEQCTAARKGCEVCSKKKYHLAPGEAERCDALCRRAGECGWPKSTAMGGRQPPPKEDGAPPDHTERCRQIAEQLRACLDAPPASGDPCRNIRLKNQACVRGEDPDK